MKRFNYFFTILFSILLWINFVEKGFAHRVSLYVYREGDKVVGEGFFSGGAPCKHCLIEIYDSSGKKLLQVFTDENGKFEVPLKSKEELRVKLIAGEGHVSEQILSGVKDEIKTKKYLEKDKPKVDSEKQVKDFKGLEVNEEILRRLVKEVVNEEMSVLRSNFMDLKKELTRVRFQDILGGIGYILGILGILAFVKSNFRKSKN